LVKCLLDIALARVDSGRHGAPRFEAIGPFGAFGGTCLYARVDGEWDCYTIKPSAAATIASAEAWLVKRDWQDWG
jgi:hypothetical protein